MITMNYTLAESKGLSEERIKLLEMLYTRLHGTLSRPQMFTAHPKDAVNRVRQIEYALQFLWGFEENPDWFIYEFFMKGCTCPKMDNRELQGMSHKVIDESCPFHSNRQVAWEELEE